MLLLGARIIINLSSNVTPQIKFTRWIQKNMYWRSQYHGILIISFSNIKYCKLIDCSVCSMYAALKKHLSQINRPQPTGKKGVAYITWGCVLYNIHPVSLRRLRRIESDYSSPIWFRSNLRCPDPRLLIEVGDLTFHEWFRIAIVQPRSTMSAWVSHSL